MKFIKPSKKSILVVTLSFIIFACVSVIVIRFYPIISPKIVNNSKKENKKEFSIKSNIEQNQKNDQENQEDNKETDRERLIKWLGLTEAEKKMVTIDHDQHTDNLDPIARVSKITVNEDGTKTYSCPKFGFEVSFPKEWNILNEQVGMNYYSKLYTRLARWYVDENGDNKFTDPVSINVTTKLFADNFLKNHAKETEKVEISGIKSTKYIACDDDYCDVDDKEKLMGYIIPIGDLRMMIWSRKIDKDDFKKTVANLRFTIPPGENPMLNKEWDDDGDYNTYYKIIGGHGFMFKFYKTWFDKDSLTFNGDDLRCSDVSDESEKERKAIKEELFAACSYDHTLVIRLVRKEQVDAFIPECQTAVSEISIGGEKAKQYICNKNNRIVGSTTITPFYDLYLIFKYTGSDDIYKKSMDKIISTFTFL